MTCVYVCVKKGDEPLQNIVGNLSFSLICVFLKETVGCAESDSEAQRKHRYLNC